MGTLLKRAVTDLFATTTIILDSNSVFIDHILEVKGLSGVVEKVFTNPAWWDGDKLCIKPFHGQDSCQLSTRNLCKGQIVEDYLRDCTEKGTKFSYIGYVGDGKNDYCPSLRLTESDVVFPRQGYSLQKVILEERDENEKIKAEVCYWSSGETIFKKLIEKSLQA